MRFAEAMVRHYKKHVFNREQVKFRYSGIVYNINRVDATGLYYGDHNSTLRKTTLYRIISVLPRRTLRGIRVEIGIV